MTKAEKTLAIMASNKKHHDTERILRYMIQHPEGITGRDAWALFGTYRLAVIIHNLRHIWHLEIETAPEPQADGGHPYARYILVKEGGQESA